MTFLHLKSFVRSAALVLVLGLILAAPGVHAEARVYRLQVDGLSCPFCAYGIEKKLGAVAGVDHLETSIKSGTVTLTMKEGATLDEASAKQAVKAAGFRLRKLEYLQPASPDQPAG